MQKKSTIEKASYMQRSMAWILLHKNPFSENKEKICGKKGNAYPQSCRNVIHAPHHYTNDLVVDKIKVKRKVS